MANSSRNPDQVLLEAEQKGYSRILFQQGKPVCDFELTLLGDLANPRRIAAPYIGSGVPAGSDGFAIGNLDRVNSDFTINAGRCLVSGIEVVLHENTTYKTQPHQERVGPFPKGFPAIYLHVFPTEITDQEDEELKNEDDVGTVTAVRERMDWEVVVSAAAIDQPDHYLLATFAPDDKGPQIVSLSSTVNDRRRKGLTTAALRDEFELLVSTNSDLSARVNAISNPDGTLKNNVVGTAQLANNSVTATKIADGSVTAGKIADGSVTGPKLAANAVTNTQLANNAVTGNKITDGSVTGTKLTAGAVANAQLADNAVTVNKILDGNVTATKLAANAVTNAQLANNAVTTNKILDGSVTGIKLPANAITGIQLADNAVTTNKIVDGNVTATKLAANAVTNAQLANNAVTTNKILDGSVTGIKLPANAITGIQLADNAVTTNKIVDGNVTATKLAVSAVNEPNLVDNAVSKRTIQDKAVSMAELGLTLVFDGQASLLPATLVGPPGQQVVVPGQQFIQLLTADAHAFFLISVRLISPRQVGVLNGVNWMQRSIAVLSAAPGNPAIHQHQVALQNFSTTATLTVACRAFRLAET